MKKYLLILVLLSGCETLHENYVKQDRQNYETLAPRIEKMMETSDHYTEDQEQDIKDRLKAWDAWTTQAMETFAK